MKEARSIFQVKLLKLQLCSMLKLKVLSIKTIKMAPWIGPNVFDHSGLSKRYFMGTAMKTSPNRVIPSKKPRMRNLPIFVLNK